MSHAVLAPGKAMLIGEYAVLEGEPAVVAAVSVYARAVLGGGSPSSPFIEAAIRETHVELLELSRSILGPSVPHVDTSAFVQGGRKLGVGSSAAATVAAVGALLHAAGLDLSDEKIRARAYAAAKRAHDSEQGTAGSGADLWAAVHGKLRVLGPYDTAVEARPLRAHLYGPYRFQHSARCMTAKLWLEHHRNPLDASHFHGHHPVSSFVTLNPHVAAKRPVDNQKRGLRL